MPREKKSKPKPLPRKRLLPARLNGAHDSFERLIEPEEIPIEQVGKRIAKPKPEGAIRQNFGNGRFNRLFHEYQEDYPQQAAAQVLNGATEKELVTYFKTTLPVLRMWKTCYPEFAQALVISRQASLADANVMRSMYEMANGYEIPAVKIFNQEGDGHKIIRYTEQVPRNFNAAKFWLMNRDPERWGRDPDSAKSPNVPGQINIGDIRGMSTDQLRKLMQVLQAALTPNQSLRRLDAVEAEEIELVKQPEESDGT